MSGIITSMSTRSIGQVRFDASLQRFDRFATIAGDLHQSAARLENAGEGVDVPHVVFDDQDTSAFEQRVTVPRLSIIRLLFVRQLRDDLMQK